MFQINVRILFQKQLLLNYAHAIQQVTLTL